MEAGAHLSRVCSPISIFHDNCKVSISMHSPFSRATSTSAAAVKHTKDWTSSTDSPKPSTTRPHKGIQFLGPA